MIEIGLLDDTYAQLGNLILERGATEPVGDFHERARDLARDLGADMLIWGRLLPVVWTDDPEPRSVIDRMLREGDWPFYHYDDELNQVQL
jgi:hypothetical protein